MLEDVIQRAERNLAMKVVRDEQKYSEFLKGMIIEGLIKLLEPVVYVRYHNYFNIRCLKRDSRIIANVIPDCKKQFA